MAYPKFRDRDWYNNFWRENPEAYGDPSKSTTDFISQAYLNLVSQGISRPTVLDVGSGSGRYSILMESIGFEVTAIDISQSAIDILRNKSSHIRLICANFLDSEILGEGKFDFVFSSGCIDELKPENHISVLDKMKHLIRKNGLILLKYCLEIKNRGTQVEGNFIPTQFDSKFWNILYMNEEKEMRPYPQGIVGEDELRTGILFAQKRL